MELTWLTQLSSSTPVSPASTPNPASFPHFVHIAMLLCHPMSPKTISQTYIKSVLALQKCCEQVSHLGKCNRTPSVSSRQFTMLPK